MGLSERIRQRVTEYDAGVGRVFVRCNRCQRIVPYYEITGSVKRVGCRCGANQFVPVVIPEWQAALRVLWGWASGQGDPRMPVRVVDSNYV